MFRILLAFALLAAAPAASAWGALGHRLVAALAEQALAPAARLEVDRLLAGEPEPTLVGVSTWADGLRARDPGLGRRSARWHYVNLGEERCTYLPARDCPGGDCVVGAITRQLDVLRDRRQPIEARRRALKFVVHFVGDVHQPLHAAHARDKGGNTVQLRVPSASGERGSNLHAWWDSGMLRHTGLDEPGYRARLRPLPATGDGEGRAPASTPADWAREACRIALSPGVYPPRRRLSPAYAATWTPVAEAQLRRAGARLARALNEALTH